MADPRSPRKDHRAAADSGTRRRSRRIRVRSAGVAVVRRINGEWHFLLLRCFGYWDFPKGKVETGETQFQAALREVTEETTLTDLHFRWGRQYRETAPYARGKVARYYLGESPRGEVSLPISEELGRPEHDDFRWVELDRALAMTTPRVQAIVRWAQARLDAGPIMSTDEADRPDSLAGCGVQGAESGHPERSAAMPTNYDPLDINTLDHEVRHFKPGQHLPERVNLESPAVDCMTDFRQVTALTTRMTTSLDEALDRMVRQGVRLLLVTDNAGVVYGVISARDIQGEKRLRLAQKLGHEPNDLLVRDMMTLKPKLEVLRYTQVLRARVGNVVATLRASGRQHVLVVDEDPDHDHRLAVRGILSLAQIGKQMGLDLDTSERPTTYAEIEDALRGA